MIEIRRESKISVREFQQVLEESALAERRPVWDHDRLAMMLRNSNLILCARDQGRLIAIARCMSDFAYCCYLSDLAVIKSYQNMGIGKQILNQIESYLHPEAKIVLLSSPSAVGYYPKAGFEKHPASFVKV